MAILEMDLPGAARQPHLMTAGMSRSGCEYFLVYALFGFSPPGWPRCIWMPPQATPVGLLLAALGGAFALAL